MDGFGKSYAVRYGLQELQSLMGCGAYTRRKSCYSIAWWHGPHTLDSFGAKQRHGPSMHTVGGRTRTIIKLARVWIASEWRART